MEHLVISAIGFNNPQHLSELFLIAAKSECTIEESRMTIMGSEIAVIMLVAGTWNTIAKMEAGLQGLEKNFNLHISRTKPYTPTEDLLSYLVNIVALNQAGIVYEIIQFFLRQNIYIDDIQTTTYAGSFSNVIMLSMSMRIGIPAFISISDLREQFALLCDDFNLDGMLEPEKP